jgi:hypothetical protein
MNPLSMKKILAGVIVVILLSQSGRIIRLIKSLDIPYYVRDALDEYHELPPEIQLLCVCFLLALAYRLITDHSKK